jgi:hypothetical protein
MTRRLAGEFIKPLRGEFPDNKDSVTAARDTAIAVLKAGLDGAKD